MDSPRSLKFALVACAAVLASASTFAWVDGIVRGHRADHIGTFEPISQHLVPAGTTPKVVAPAPHLPETTTTTVGNPAGDDNGRSNDD